MSFLRQKYGTYFFTLNGGEIYKVKLTTLINNELFPLTQKEK